MQGRTLALALVLLSLTMPAAASAAPMPDGTYNVTLTGGKVKIGAGLIPELTLSGTGTFPMTVAGQPVSLPVPPVTVPQTMLSQPLQPFGTLTGTLDVTVPSVSGTIDPATGNATVDVSFYATALVSTTGLVVASTTCTIGDAAHPLTLHLTTASGAPFDATTGKFTLTDKTFAVPALACGNGTIGSLINSLLGDTSGGKNDAQMFGDAQRVEGSSGGSGGGSGGGGTGTTPTTPTTTTPGVTTPTTRVAPRTCKVPKLKGKRLGSAKRAIRKAGCKVGKVKSKTSKRKKKGTVLSQSRRAGTKVPLGTRIALTVAKRRTR